MKLYKYNAYLLLAWMACLGACTDMDDYKKFLEGGEITYAGKLTSVVVYPGDERILITGLLASDPNITMCKVFWNYRRDSLVIPIERSAGVDTVQALLTGMPEGVMGFEIVTYDSFGNSSVVVNAIGTVYGARYESSLLNRGITFYDMPRNGDYKNALIEWAQADETSGMIGVEVIYTDTDGAENAVVISATESATTLEAFKPSTYAKFRALFSPDSLCLDTFYTAYDSIKIITPLLKNKRVPFIASSKNGRWGILADWTTNDAARNHDGYGGWDEWNSNIFNVESGWGAPDVTNGKIYQTNLLEPGTYTFEIADLLSTNLTDADPVYLVAAAGNTLPDVEQVDESIAYATIPVRKITFTVDVETEVSVGFLTSQQGNKYCNVRAFDFYKHPE